MSEAKRAYNVLRSYVNQEWERVKGLDVMDAWRELDAPASTTSAAPSAPSFDSPQPGMDNNELEANKILNSVSYENYDNY